MWKAILINKWEKFGKRTYLGEYEYYQGKYKKLKCQCECWNISFISPSMLVRWKNKSCYRCSIVTHRLDSPRMYCIRDKMKLRCNNPKHTAYYNYWWRWIKILWNNFDEFYADMHESYENHVKEHGEKNTTIDRIDSNWNYCKENCKRSTRLEQNCNQRRTHHVEYKWKHYNSLSELCRDINADYQLVRDRVNHWWNLKDAIEKEKLYTRKK
jgi:hypothetical protein